MYHFSNIYKKNKKYRFNANQLGINNKDLDKFNSCFNILKAKFQKKKEISNFKIKSSFDQCNSIHKKIFNDLVEQTSDKKLIKFLKSIEFFSYKNLEETLNFFLKSKQFKALNNKNYNLLKKNFYYKGYISKKNLELLLNISNKYLPELLRKAKAGKTRRSDLTISDLSFNKKISKILNLEFKKNGVLNNLKSFFGYEMIVAGAALELSIPSSVWWKKNSSSNMAKNLTSYIHTDESLTVPKSIIYLSDVKLSNGPLTFYPNVLKKIGIENNPFAKLVGGTIHNVVLINKKLYKHKDQQPMTSRNLRNHFMCLPEDIRLSSHFGWDIKRNSKIEKLIDSKKDIMLGKKGRFAIFDGYSVLHRGGIINDNYRLVLQVTLRKKLSKLNLLYNLVKKNFYKK